jgi:hypothetical protein
MDMLVAIVSIVVMVAVVGFLVWSLVTSIRQGRRRSGTGRIWANFGLSLVLVILFFASWATQAFAQWAEYRDEQRAHGETAQVDGYLVGFAQSTLENWQSEFLQLFSFVVLAAVFIHRGSSESKDGDERIERLLHEIKAKLDA